MERKVAAAILLGLLAVLVAAAAWAQFIDVVEIGSNPGHEFIRQIASGVTPDSQKTFTVGIRDARRIAFYFRANRANTAGSSTCSLAVLQVSQNDTDYTDASGITGLTVNDNLTGQCVTDSCNNYDRYIEAVTQGSARFNWKFARAIVFWKVNGTPATSQIDSLRVRCRLQND